LDLLKEKKPQNNCLLPLDRFHIVAEIKQASPSKGKIPWQFTLEELVKSYESGGASLISVLTEEDFFLGSTEIFEKVRSLTVLPLLRKDFINTEYQIYESALLGADVVLLIAAILEDEKLKRFLNLAHELGLKCLVECRDAEEITTALNAGASIVGINNRNLRTFEIDLNRTKELSHLIPEHCTLISESGIHTSEDAAYVASIGADAILVGESCVRSHKPEEHMKALLQAGLQAKQSFLKENPSLKDERRCHGQGKNLRNQIP